MSSDARQAANAANAQHSTGPRTPEGKQRSAQNARKHGLTARDLIIRDDERDEFEHLLADYTEELRPQGALEQSLFDQLLAAAWNLRRLRRLESDLDTSKADPLLDGILDRTLNRLTRYHARAERSYYRALHELRTLQTNRALRDHPCPGSVEDIPPLASISELTKRTQRERRSPRSSLSSLDALPQSTDRSTIEDLPVTTGPVPAGGAAAD